MLLAGAWRAVAVQRWSEDALHLGRSLATSSEAKHARPRRALLYIPGSDESKLAKSMSSPADCIIFDCEDSVASHQKGRARENVMNALNATARRGSGGRVNDERAVRINAVGSGLELDDLEVVCRSERLDTIVIPKVNGPEDVQHVTRTIERIAGPEARSRIRVIASIESARGLVRLREICTAEEGMVDALLFAAEDFCADLGLQRTSSLTELLYARSKIVTMAKAYGLSAIDLVCINLNDEQVLKDECSQGAQLGFDGKQAIHPKQVEQIQKAFSPSPESIKRAVQILGQYEAASKSGRGAYAFAEAGGKGQTMVDAPVIKQAQKIVAKSMAAGLEIPAFEPQT